MKQKVKSFERKNELIKAALEEFTVKKYEDASLNIIIKNAGISKGTFYYHFQDKQALYLFLLKCASDAKIEFLMRRTNEMAVDFSGKDMFEAYKVQARFGAEFLAAYPEFYKLGIMFLKERGNEIYDKAKEYLGRSSESIVEDMVRKAAENGDFRSGFSIEFIVRVLGHLLMQFDQIFNREEDLEMDRMLDNLDHYVDFMKYGFGKRETR